MTRILVLLLLVILLWLAIRRLVAGFRAGLEEAASRQGRGGSRRAVTGGRLLRCAACGVRFPEDRRLVRGGESYCSPECARRGAAADRQ